MGGGGRAVGRDGEVESKPGWGWTVGEDFINPCLPIDTVSDLKYFYCITKETEFKYFYIFEVLFI